MRFVFVNDRKHLGQSRSVACSRAVRPDYTLDISSHRPYCDYDCHARHQSACLFMPSSFMPWLVATRADPWSARRHSPPLELITSFATASWWYSISLVEAGLRLGELMANEGT